MPKGKTISQVKKEGVMKIKKMKGDFRTDVRKAQKTTLTRIKNAKKRGLV